MTQVYTIHNFLYTLNYENKVKGHKVIFTDRNNKEKSISLSKIEIGTSRISCKLYDDKGERFLVPFMRIKKVFLDKELVFDNSDVNQDNVKVIKGWK